MFAVTIGAALLATGIAVSAACEQPEWRKGDYLLLCSDGLTNMVEDSELRSLIAAGGADIERSCQEAIDRANQNGGKDNITAVLAYYD